jgi:hypothetical protein
MPSEDEVGDLITAFSDAGIEPQRWPKVLEDFAQLFGASYGGLVVASPAGRIDFATCRGAKLIRCVAAAALTMSASAFAQAPVQVNQIFNSQGPAPAIGVYGGSSSSGDGGAIPGNPPNLYGTVSGAVQSIAVAPNSNPMLLSNTFFVGTVAGGVWKTTDGGASWIPQTDNQGSLAIASLSVDPTDSSGNTVVAGIGLTTNGFSNAARTGVLVTTDGGGSWSALGNTSNELAGQSVVGVVKRDSTILAATFEERFAQCASCTYGLYRSINGHAFSRDTDLPAGPVSALAGDPTNSATLYAAVTSNPNGTIYLSRDTGAHWSSVLTDTAANNQTVVKLATGPGGSIAAAFIDTSSNSIQKLYWSKDSGTTWVQLPTANMPQFGGQGVVNSTLAIDPTNNALVYVAGVNGPFRVNFDTLTASPISDGMIPPAPVNTANGSGAHGDFRALTFDSTGANHALIAASDGGIYKRTSPTDNTGVWQGLNTTLSAFEPYAIGYDVNTKRVTIAAQDNGVAVQSVPGSGVYTATHQFDGTIVAVNDRTLVGQGLSAVYGAVQNLAGLSRIIYDPQGNIVSPNTSTNSTNPPTGLEWVRQLLVITNPVIRLVVNSSSTNSC